MSNGIDSLVECIRRRNEAIAERQWRRFETSYRRQVLGARPDPRDEPGRPAALRSVRGKFLDAIVSPDSRSRRPEPRMLPKIVFLLGAGTSLSAGVPLASTVVDECRKAIGRATLKSEVNRMRAEFARQNSRETAWGRHLVDQKGAGDFSFEEVLSAYRYLVGEPELLELMRRRFRVTEGDRDRSLITLFNECLAHLCREQLVDFIVSLNFDELLEMSLDEDIGRDGYVRIVEEARFRWAGQYGLVRSDDDYTDPEQRRAKDGCERARPWLLKPHGTISHESTLCHLAGQVYRLGSEKEAVLKEVFADSCLVVVGYGLTALDFHRILMSHAVTGSIRQLIWVDPARHPGPMGTKLAQAMRRSRPGSFVHVSMEADDFALKLSERLYGDPSGAAGRSRRASSVVMAGMLPPYRHFLRAFAFQRSSPGRPGVSCCFENRFVVECIALAVRMRGWWSSRALARSHQIQHLLRNATQEQRDRLSNLPGLLAPYFVSFPRRGRSERIYILRKRLTYRGAAGADPLGRDAAEGQREFVRRIQRCLPRYAAGSQRKDAARVTREMGRLIRQHPDVALYEEPDDLGTIRHAVLIHATPVRRGLTDWLLERTSNLYVVSETGEYLAGLSAKARGSRRSKFAGIMLGDYERLAEEIRASLEGVGVRGVYFEDIAKSAERVRGWPKTAEPNRKGVGAVIETFKKRYHFTLWCDEDNDRVAGIVYTRIDRQPGATFYWVELDLTHPDDKSQFDAWKSYMGC